MTDLLDRVAHALTRHDLIAPGDRVLAGVSGGADSLVLLHALCALREPFGFTLHAATLDHGMRGAAGAADADFVRETAHAWGIPVIVGRADVPALARSHRMGLEETARQVRYAFMVRAARRVGASRIAVGHQQDDQAETVLLHLARGSGLDGLRGMLPVTPLDRIHRLDDAAITFDPPGPDGPESWPLLIRPLLAVSRADIDAYAAAHGLVPCQDATNLDTGYTRNHLRHRVIPLLEQLNPNIRETLARTADVLQADADFVRAAGEAALTRLARDDRPGAIILDRAGWGDLAVSVQRAAIRAAVFRLRPGLRDVSWTHVENARDIAARGVTNTAATLPGGLVLRVDYDTLAIADANALILPDAPGLEPGQGGPAFSPGDTVRRAFGGWLFEAEPLAAATDVNAIHADPLAAALSVPARARLALRTRRPGERFRPRGLGGHSQKLSDTLIIMRVPAAWRDRVPLLTVNDAAAWCVVPTPDGLRGRVGESFALPESPDDPDRAHIVARWQRLV